MTTLAAIEVGTAYVSVVPSLRGFGTTLQSQLGTPLTSAGLSAGQATGAAVVAGAQTGLSSAAPVLGRTGEKIGTGAGEGVKSGLVTTLGRAGPQLNAAGQALTVGLTAPLAGLGLAAFKTSISFESAFADVRKTVDATAPQLDRIRSGIIAMANEIPASREEIAGVAAAAGQLGIATPNILGFTRVMIDLGNTTNLTSDQAADAFARLANITGLPQDQFDRLGSTVVDLGNKLASTESEITEMGLRIAGAGAQIGLSEDQILSFAGALSSVGIDAEAGGSAISRVFIELANSVASGGDRLDEFARIAGTSTTEFKNAFKRDAAGAIVSFIEGLGRVKDQGENVFGVLDDLGLSEIRVRDALLRASGAGDLFRKSLQIGSKAWKENTALSAEAEKRYGTTESKLRILSNRFGDAALQLGDALVPALLDMVDAARPAIGLVGDLARLFSGLPEPVKLLAVGIAGFAAFAGPALLIIGRIAPGLAAIKTAAVGLPGVISSIGGALKTLGGIAAANPGLLALGAALAAGAFVIAHQDDIKQFAGENFAPKTDNIAKSITTTFANAKQTWEQAQADYFRAVADPRASAHAKAQAEKNLGAARDAFIDNQRQIIAAQEDIRKKNEDFVNDPIWGTIKGAIISGTDALGITEFLQGINDDLTGFFSDLTDTITGFQLPEPTTFAGWGEDLVGFFAGIGDRIGSGFQTAIGALPGIISGTLTTVLGIAGNIGGGLLGLLAGLWNGIVSGAQSAWNFLTGIIGAAASGVLGIVFGFAGFFGSIFSGVGNTVLSVAGTIAGGIKAIVNTVIDGVNWLIGKLKGFELPSVDIGPIHLGGGRPFEGLSKIKHFAEGGLVLGPTLALVGEAGPELVIPLDRIGGALSGLDVPPINLTARITPELATRVLPKLTAPLEPDWSQVADQVPRLEDEIVAQLRRTVPTAAAVTTPAAPQAAVPTPDAGITIEVGTLVVREDADVEKIARDLHDRVRAAARSQGQLTP